MKRVVEGFLVDINGDPWTQSVIIRRTEPIWLHDMYLATGHDENTRNATTTFVARKGKIYAVTCAHVLDALFNPAMVPGAKRPTATLNASDVIIPLPVSAEHTFGLRKVDGVDIAMCRLDAMTWSMLQSRKNRIAIDLDGWREPDWEKVTYCVAVGYADEHKEHVVIDGADKVGAPFLECVAEVDGKLSRTRMKFELSSLLDKPHGRHFSGMSGGTVYALEGELDDKTDSNEVTAVGIIYEGEPASRRPRPEGSARGFITPSDIFIRAMSLNPEIFDEWLARANLA